MLEVVLIVLGLVALYFIIHRPNKKLPPGPRGLPLIGNILQIDRAYPMGTFNKWTEKYGKLYYIHQFMESVVVLNSHDLIYEVLVTRSNDFAGRPAMYRAKVMLNFADDIGFSDNTPKWRYIKKLSMQSLKMYGDGLSNLEELSMEFIQEMLDELEEHKKGGTPVDMKAKLRRCTGAIVSSVIWGERLLAAELDQLLSLERMFLEHLELGGPGTELELFPPLRFLPTHSGKKLEHLRRGFKEWIPTRNAQAKNRNKSSEPTCFMEAIGQQQRREEIENGHSVINDNDLAATAIDLITAGFITTSSTIYFLIAILVHKPEFQERIAKEIRSTIGQRPPRLSDRVSLPYTEAVILETLRYSSIAPLGIPHKATKDTTLGGYDIPAGTTIVTNLWHLHHSEEYWDEPWEFKPERFLAEDGTLVPPGHINRKRLMSFGAGRRVCVGEVLARNRLFLLVTSLFQRFHFRAEADDKIPDLDPKHYLPGFVTTLPQYNVRLVPTCVLHNYCPTMLDKPVLIETSTREDRTFYL